MYYLGSILGQGYLGHTVMQQSFHRSEEAWAALDMSVFATNTSEAAILSNLLQGETAAQNRIIYHANSVISMMQTFREGTHRIEGTLAKMNSIAARAATGVFSDLEVAAMQDQFNDQGAVLNRTARGTHFGPYHLLDHAGQEVLAMRGGPKIVLDAADLRIDADSLSLAQDATGVISDLAARRQETAAYRDYLDREIGRQEQQLAMAAYDVSRSMGYGMELPNPAFAREVVQQVVAAASTDRVVAFQAQGRPSSMTLKLAQDHLSEPFRWLHE